VVVDGRVAYAQTLFSEGFRKSFDWPCLPVAYGIKQNLPVLWLQRGRNQSDLARSM
jgi:hypothetical protein